jgi:membrane associated rhomboid family serine protease
MGIASRDYYRDSSPPAWTMGEFPAIRALIVATVAVFLLQIFSTRDVRRTFPDENGVDRVSAVTEWLKYDTEKVLHGQVWRLVTVAFCHDRFSLFHILFNMLFLYWCGTEIEALYGSRETVLFYLAGAVAASLTHLCLDLATGTHGSAVGASGAVMAVLMLCALHYPTKIINLFMILPIQLRWLVVIYAVWDLHPLLLKLAGDDPRTGIGHAAHLGGLAFGYLYYRFQWRLDRFTVRVPTIVRRPAAPRPRLRIAPGTASEPDVSGDRVDQILAKISRTGQESLTAEERTILQAESERIRRRNGQPFYRRHP